MKLETILKGNDLIKKIDNAHLTKMQIGNVSNISLVNRNQSRIGSIKIDSGNTYLDGALISPDIQEIFSSEMIRALSRIKRHIDRIETEAREELEDLTDGEFNHAVVGVAGTKKMMCLHCGTQLDVPLPIGISIFIAMSKAFIKEHKNCPCNEKCTLHNFKPISE